MLQAVLTEFRNDGKKSHKIAADLVEIADRAGIHPRDVSKHADLLKSKKLNPRDITSEVLSAAGVIERLDWQQTLLQVERINTSRRPQPKASPLVRSIHRVLSACRVAITKKGVRQCLDELEEVGIDAADVSDEILEKIQTYHNLLGVR